MSIEVIGSEHFQQSKEWRRARENTGNKTFSVGQYFVQKTKLPILKKSIGYMPKVDVLKIDYKTLVDLGEKEGCIVIQVDPINIYPAIVPQVDIRINPVTPVALQHNVVIDLKNTNEELLNSFKPKHRYNIKVAQKHGLNFSIDDTTDSFNKFLDLYAETEKRQKYTGRSRAYLKAVWESFKGKVYIAQVSKDSEVLVTWFLICHESSIYYAYGGSSDKFQNTMPSFLMVWEIIKWAKSKGYEYLDMMGITDPTLKKNRESGFTRFKLGWSNEYVKYADSFEIVINPMLYKLYKIVQFLRNFKK